MAPIGPRGRRDWWKPPCIPFFFLQQKQDTTKFDYRANFLNKPIAFCPGWACCCCPVPTRRGVPAPAFGCSTHASFSMTDWYIGSAGRWTSVTFYNRDDQSEGTMIRKESQLFEVYLGVQEGRFVCRGGRFDIFLPSIGGEVEASREVTFGMVVSYHFFTAREGGKQYTQCRSAGGYDK